MELAQIFAERHIAISATATKSNRLQSVDKEQDSHLRVCPLAPNDTSRPMHKDLMVNAVNRQGMSSRPGQSQ